MRHYIIAIMLRFEKVINNMVKEDEEESHSPLWVNYSI